MFIDSTVKPLNLVDLKILDILVRAGGDLTCIYAKGYTPLMIAIKQNDYKTIETLLSLGALVNPVIAPQSRLYPGYSALHLATIYNKAKYIVQLLLKYNADVRIKANDMLSAKANAMLSAFDCAIQHHNRGVLELLYASGSTVCKKYICEKKYRIPQFILDDHVLLLSLSGLCRRSIRIHLLKPAGGNQNNLFIAVPKLPLPGKINRFLLFNVDLSEK